MRVTPRLRWREAVQSTVFPPSLRPMKGTLLALVGLVAPTGEIHEWRDDLADAAGVPSRTLTRHLGQAVRSGWLAREVRGGHGRRSRYRLVIPSCGPSVAYNSPECVPELCAIHGPQLRELWAAHSYSTPESCGPLGGPLNKDSASVSEPVAVDKDRDRRTNPDGDSRAPGSSSSKGGVVGPDHDDRRDDDGDGSAADHDGSASQSDSADPDGSAGHVRMPTENGNGNGKVDPLLARFTEADRLREAGVSKQLIDTVLNGGTVS